MYKSKYILHATLGFGGGVGSFLKELIYAQLDSGYKIGIIYQYVDSETHEKILEWFPDCDVFPVKKQNIKGMNMLFGLPIRKLYYKIKRVECFSNICVHAHNPASIGYFSNINKVPILCTVHSENSGKGKLSQYLTTKILFKLQQNDSIIVCVSNSMRNFYTELTKNTEICTIHNAIAISKSKCKYDFQKFSIGFVSNLDDFKGWKYLLDAYIKLDPKRREQISLIFAGKVDLIAKAELKAYCDKYQNVEYLGLVENAGINLVPALDVVVLPSINEGLPMILLESISNGIPVLATNVGGIPELLEDGINGYFIKRDAEDICTIITRIFDNPSLYNELSVNAKQTYLEKFEITNMKLSYDNLYLNFNKED